MTRALENCLFARIGRRFGFWYQFSLLAAFFRFMSSCYERSVFKRFWDGWTLAPMSSTFKSRLYRLVGRIDDWLHRLGSKLIPILRGSVIYKCYNWLITSQTARSSAVCRAVFNPGMRRVLLVVFALFVPIDKVLRDVVGIAFLASVWDDAVLLGGFIYLFLRCIFGQDAQKPRMTPLDQPIFLFLGVGLFLMFYVSPYMNIAIAGYRATVQYILWFFLIYKLIEDDKDIMTVIYIMVGMTVLIALHGIYQYIVAVPIPDSWTTSTETAVRTRVYSIFGSPNIMGDFMALMAPITASLAYYFKDIKLKVLVWGCVLLMCFACLFTMSRGAWLGLAVAILVFALYNDRRLLALLVVAAIVAISIPSVYNRIAFLFTDEFVTASASGGRAGRKQLALLYLQHFSNPWFGFGLGMFGGAVAMQHKIYLWVSYCYVDNYYLKIMTEMGYIGLAAFIFMIIGFASSCMRSIARARKKDDGFGQIAAGIFSGLCGVLAHCFFENIFEEPYMMAYFWGLTAVLLYIGFARDKKGRDDAGGSVYGMLD